MDSNAVSAEISGFLQFHGQQAASRPTPISSSEIHTTPRFVFAVLATFSLISACEREPDNKTFRVPVSDQLVLVSNYHSIGPEQSWVSAAVYDRLIDRNIDGSYSPSLASSWEQLDLLTYQFEIRRDVVFHNGNHLDADDIVYLIDWLTDPDSKIIGKIRFAWIDRAEKIGPYTVRIVSKSPTSTALASLATVVSVLDSETHRTYDNKIDYARLTPVGTGPYKIVRMDRNNGILLERFRERTWGKLSDNSSNVNLIELIPLPDKHAQLAMLLTGDLHLARNLGSDLVDSLLARSQELRMVVSRGLAFTFISFDSVNRSGNEALSDRRVRLALFTAIDRQALMATTVPGGEHTVLMTGMCLPIQDDCKFGVPTPEYDPQGARTLLTEAGYADGLEVIITTDPSLSMIATTISGDWEKIGVASSIQSLPRFILNQKFAAGDIQVFIGLNTHRGVAAELNQLLRSSSVDYYWDDELLLTAQQNGVHILDKTEREELYGGAFDQMNQMAYILPIVELPTVFLHPRSVGVRPDPISPYGTELIDLSWNPSPD